MLRLFDSASPPGPKTPTDTFKRIWWMCIMLKVETQKLNTSHTLGWTIVSSSFCLILSSMKICWTLESKGSIQSGLPPKMEYVFRAHLFGKKVDTDKLTLINDPALHKTAHPFQVAPHQSKWSWKPLRPSAELRYWYTCRSPSRVATRSSPRVSTAPLLLHLIRPAVTFTLNCEMKRSWGSSRITQTSSNINYL